MIGWLETGLKIIDKVIPDPAQKIEAQQRLMEMEQSGELSKLGLEVQDRSSARELAKVQGTRIQAALSYFIVIGFFGTLSWAISGRIPATVDNMYVGALLGTLGTMTVQVINFWFGSSNGSSMKNHLLSEKQK